ncbi:hypothetical protein STEG23_010247, partial [Scotinomys teguina]
DWKDGSVQCLLLIERLEFSPHYPHMLSDSQLSATPAPGNLTSFPDFHRRVCDLRMDIKSGRRTVLRRNVSSVEGGR